MIGVDYDLFWTLNPKSLSPFIKAFNLKLEHEDTVAWKYGVYVRMAIISAMDKNAKYPSNPIMMNKQVEKDNTMSEEEIKRRVMNHAQMINSKFRKE